MLSEPVCWQCNGEIQTRNALQRAQVLRATEQVQARLPCCLAFRNVQVCAVNVLRTQKPMERVPFPNTPRPQFRHCCSTLLGASECPYVRHRGNKMLLGSSPGSHEIETARVSYTRMDGCGSFKSNCVASFGPGLRLPCRKDWAQPALRVC
jgi:hypothetical protein